MPSIKRVDSTDTDVSKYVFNFNDAVAEAVLYKYGSYEERTVICCSTQSGCPVGCRFCGTGEYFVRNLTADEIVSQVAHMFKDRDIDPTQVKKGQIMFMSMGEPMLNFKQLSVAMRALASMYPNFALLISTSGPAANEAFSDLMVLSQEIPQIGLQFSVHESTDEARNELIPFKAKFDLDTIAIVGTAWHQATGRQPFFNYCAHERNSSVEDANRLYALFNPAVWQATVSVICERTESVAAANERQRELATGFMSKLVELGFSVRCFNPAGQTDIGGGCGQLWFVQNWMKTNPQYARPTCGMGRATVHPTYPIDTPD